MENGTTPLVEIRQASLRDLHHIRTLWLAMIAEERTKPYYPWPHEHDDDRLTQDIASVIQTDQFGAALALDPSGVPIGFVAVEQMHRRYGQPETFAQFHAIYVEPPYRHHDVSLRLGLWVGRWCDARGIVLLECDNQAGNHPPWWKAVGMPFKAIRVHYASRVVDLVDSINAFTRRRTPRDEPTAEEAVLDLGELPGDVDIDTPVGITK